MSVDPSIVGTELPPLTMTIEPARLCLFAKAIGGRYDAKLPVPPTFLMAIGAEDPQSGTRLAELGIDIRRVLHGEQEFTYHSPAYAGDKLRAARRIADFYSKKGGALDFLVMETNVTRIDGSAVADFKTVLVVRN